MTETQLYLAIGVPIIVNLAFNGLLAIMLSNHLNARMEAQDKLFTERLLRVEQVIDARLRLIEEKLGIR